jgi:hypothetical protein
MGDPTDLAEPDELSIARPLAANSDLRDRFLLRVVGVRARIVTTGGKAENSGFPLTLCRMNLC